LRPSRLPRQPSVRELRGLLSSTLATERFAVRPPLALGITGGIGTAHSKRIALANGMGQSNPHLAPTAAP